MISLWVGLVLAAAPSELPQRRLLYQREASAATCPDEAQLRLRVAAQLGYDPFSPLAAKQIAITLSRDGHFTALFTQLNEAGQPIGQRELRSPSSSCAELFSAVELAVALAIDPTRKGRKAAAAQPPVLPPPVVSPAPSERKPLPWELEASLGGSAIAGAAPHPQWGPQLGVRFLPWAWLSLFFDAALYAPAKSPLEGGGFVSTSGAAGTAGACLHRDLIGLCLGGTGGVLWFEGEGLADNRQGAAARSTALARIEVAPRLSKQWKVRAFVGADLALYRATLHVDDQPVWVTPAWGGHLGLAAAWGAPL